MFLCPPQCSKTITAQPFKRRGTFLGKAFSSYLLFPFVSKSRAARCVNRSSLEAKHISLCPPQCSKTMTVHLFWSRGECGAPSKVVFVIFRFSLLFKIQRSNMCKPLVFVCQTYVSVSAAMLKNHYCSTILAKGNVPPRQNQDQILTNKSWMMSKQDQDRNWS